MKTLLILAICVAAQQIAFTQQKEKNTLPAAPTYQGTSLGEWMALTKDKDKKVRRDAASALEISATKRKQPSPPSLHYSRTRMRAFGLPLLKPWER